jgi:hypothetical protein
MQRRAFLQMLCVGIGAVTAMPAHAFIPPASSGHDRRSEVESAVATQDDVERVQVEDAQYGRWRRVGRRHYRRVGRRVYRRHYRRVGRRIYRRHYYY